MATKGSERDSNMELLRLVAIFFIILYHLTLFFTYSAGQDNKLMYSMNLMLHTGVVLFVLISGYYGIRFSFKGLLKVLAIMFVYYVPMMLVKYKYFNNGEVSLMDSVCFVSRTSYWYMRTYIILFLLSPIINKCIETINAKQRIFLLIVLFVIAVYFAMQGKDPSLSDGKNIVNFFFIYLLGNTVRKWESDIKKAVKIKFFYIWLVYNLITVGLCYFFKDNFIGKAVFSLNFAYCSPGLLLNSVLLFIAFTDLHFKSKAVNYAAGSVLGVYLIHGHPLIRYFLRINIVDYVQKTESNLNIILCWVGLSICILLVCIFIDKLFQPLWRLAQKAGAAIDKKVGLNF